ncbi:MAG: acyl carrier protein [Chloroflexi bacterium]|nr:acyl carrier protein [Chloroflexota bacterium]
MPSVEEKIRSYIAENILFSDNGYTYPDDTSFLEEGIVDSMNVLELIMFVEEVFHITVEDEEITPDNFDSVSKLAAYVRRKMPLSCETAEPAT